MKRIAIALLLFGCPTKPAPKPNPPPPAGSEAGSGSDTGSAQPPANGPGMGEKCGAADACGAGLECVKYYGIAGPRSPEFKTCEKRCKVDADCGTGKCRTSADGPGQVCRGS